MKVKFTNLLNHYQDDTINIKEKDITNSKKIMELTGMTNRGHIKMTKRAISWSIGIAVAMMSCVTVYAVENGAIDTLKEFFNNKNIPYSYSGTYNQIDKNYIYENISTDFTTEVLYDNNSDTHIEITGYVADEYNMYIIGDVVFDNNDLGSLKGFSKVYHSYDDKYLYEIVDYVLQPDSKFYNMTYKDAQIFASVDELETINWEEKYPIEDIKTEFLVEEDGTVDNWTWNIYYYNTTTNNYEFTQPPYIQYLGNTEPTEDTNLNDNRIPIICRVDSYNVTMQDIQSIDICIDKLTTNPATINDNIIGVEIGEKIRVNFTRESLNNSINSMVNTIDNLNIDCDDYTIDSFSYSPLGFNIKFKDTVNSTQNQGSYSIYTKDFNTYSYPNVYLIYKDGTKVLQNSRSEYVNINPITAGYANKYCINGSIYDSNTNEIVGYNLSLCENIIGGKHNYSQPVDYTNVVSVEINGVVIPLK